MGVALYMDVHVPHAITEQLRLRGVEGVPLGEPTRRATDFISRFILAGGDKTRLEFYFGSTTRRPFISRSFKGFPAGLQITTPCLGFF
jgi:hypothetical protein